jgi:hypothetical protein
MLWTWLTTPPGVADVLDPFGLVFIAVFSVGFLTSAYLSGPDGGKVFAHGAPHAPAVRQWVSVGLWIFGSGLFYFAMRTLQINPLSFGGPIWLVASVVALAVAGARFVRWRSSTASANQSWGSSGTSEPFPVSRGRPICTDEQV